MPKNSNSKSKKGGQSRRPSTRYYENNSKRCCEINYDSSRCKNPAQLGGLCTRHRNLRDKKRLEHTRLMKKRGKIGGQSSQQIYEYDYYLEDEIESNPV